MKKQLEKKTKKSVAIGLALAVMLLAIVSMSVSLWQEYAKRRKNIEKESGKHEVIQLDLTYAYQNPQWNSAIEKLIRDFESDYPGIQVNYEIQYEDQVYEDVLAKKIARNELGDLVQMKSPKVYAQNQLLTPISSKTASLTECVYEWNGSVYGVGAVETTSGILYNRDIFTRYGLSKPDSWEEFLALCQTLKEKGIMPVGMGGGDLWHMEYWVNHAFRTDVLSENAGWLSACREGKVSWTDAEPRRMMEHLLQLFENGYVNADWQMTTDGGLTYKMSEGEVAMIFTGPWTAATIQNLNDTIELGWFLLPGEDQKVYAADNLDTFWSVTAECGEDPETYEAAMTFLEYFYDPEHYMKICQEITAIPLIREAEPMEKTGIQDDVLDAFARADVRQTAYIGNEDTPEDFEKNFLLLTKRMLAGELSADETLKEIQEEWERAVGQEETS